MSWFSKYNSEKHRNGYRRWLLKAAIPVLLIFLWELVAIVVNNEFILPRLESVLMVVANPFTPILGTGSLVDNALISLERVIVGFVVGSIFAIPLGIAMGRWALIHDLFDSVVQIFRPIPPLAWVPLALAWFKIGLTSMVFIIALGTFFPVLLNTLDGVRSVKKTWIEMAAILGARELQMLRTVVLPAALPTIWTGLRLGFGIAWMCVVAAEMMPGTTSGLGYLIIYSYNFGQVPVIIAGMIAIGVIGLGIDLLLGTVEKRWFMWRELER